jgi:SIR2-like domain
MADEICSEPAGTNDRRFDDLTAAIVGMFKAMGLGFMQRPFEFQNEVRYMVATFLTQFDAIFTLNQDTLLEQHYLDAATGGKWNGYRIPGIKPLGSDAAILGTPQAKIAPRQPDPDNFRLSPSIQPYIKLHGSCNWSAGASGRRILIMGGQKGTDIERFPILNWYHSEFRKFLSKPDARLMVIGYSFSDTHINAAIEEGVDKGLKLFIIDPGGVDVLDDKRKKVIGPRREQHMEVLARSVIGASRRPLTSTFNGDVVEHQRIMKFFS